MVEEEKKKTRERIAQLKIAERKAQQRLQRVIEDITDIRLTIYVLRASLEEEDGA